MSDNYLHSAHVTETLVTLVKQPSFSFALPPISDDEWEQVLGVPPAPNQSRPPNIIFRREVADRDIVEFAGDGLIYYVLTLALHLLIPEECIYDVSCLA